jgi:hypothetical protein
VLEGFSYTYLLIILCVIGSVLGSFANVIVKSINVDGPPVHEDKMKIASKELQEKRGIWIGLRMILGGILGLVVGLYFVGSIQETPATLAKIMALSIMVGYAAPKIWESQEKIIDAKLRVITESSISSDKNA